MPVTDMDILQRAYRWEEKNPQYEWNPYAVGASGPARLKPLVDAGYLAIIYKGAYKMTEKGKGIVAVSLNEQEVARVPVERIMESFKLIKGFEDLKEQIAGVVHRRQRVHYLLSGPPSCAKSLFLSGVEDAVGPMDAAIAFGSRTTPAGLSDLLFEQQPSVLLLDELDKMPPPAFAVLLGLMEKGLVIETKSKSHRGLNLNTVVLAACNDFTKLSPELISRFSMHARFPHYQRHEFIDVSEHFLHLTEGAPPDLAREIGAQVFDRQLGDHRKVRAVWQLMEEGTEVAMLKVLDTMERYTFPERRTPSREDQARLL